MNKWKNFCQTYGLEVISIAEEENRAFRRHPRARCYRVQFTCRERHAGIKIYAGPLFEEVNLSFALESVFALIQSTIGCQNFERYLQEYQESGIPLAILQDQYREGKRAENVLLFLLGEQGVQEFYEQGYEGA